MNDTPSTAALRSNRQGITLLNVIVLIGIVCVGIAFVLPAINSATSSRRQDTCRSNLSNLATAMILYDGRNGKLPGYMNALYRQDGSAYRDPNTKESAPVSWVVELLTDLDRGALYEIWRTPFDIKPENSPTGTATGTAAAAAPSSTSNSGYIANTKVYLDLLVCPNDSQRSRWSGTPISYVVNTGMPDLPRSILAKEAGGANVSVGMPRDWQANGMFFDNYSDDKLIKPNKAERGPQIVMRLSQVRDPKDKTIMLTENLDATSYVFDKREFPGGDPALTEVVWGSVWAPGKTEPNPNDATHKERGKFIVDPRDDVSAPNALNDGRRHPFGYKYCRPSSPHPEGFNVAFAGKNVIFVNDKISYYVYTRLMASDDVAMKLPGSQALLDHSLRGQLEGDADVNP